MHNIVRNNFIFQRYNSNILTVKSYIIILYICLVFSYVKNSFVRSKIWTIDYKNENPKIVLEIT